MAALDAPHSRYKVIEHNKNDTQEQHTSATSGLDAQEHIRIYIWAIWVILLCRKALKEFLFKDTQAADGVKPATLPSQGNLPDNWATRLLHWYEHANKWAQDTQEHTHTHIQQITSL